MSEVKNTDETYLDSLLNSVKNKEPNSKEEKQKESIYTKKEEMKEEKKEDVDVLDTPKETEPPENIKKVKEHVKILNDEGIDDSIDKSLDYLTEVEEEDKKKEEVKEEEKADLDILDTSAETQTPKNLEKGEEEVLEDEIGGIDDFDDLLKMDIDDLDILDTSTETQTPKNLEKEEEAAKEQEIKQPEIVKEIIKEKESNNIVNELMEDLEDSKDLVFSEEDPIKEQQLDELLSEEEADTISLDKLEEQKKEELESSLDDDLEDTLSLDDLEEFIDESVHIEDEGASNTSDMGDILSDVLGVVNSQEKEEQAPAQAAVKDTKKDSDSDTKEKDVQETKGMFQKLFGNLHDEKAKNKVKKQHEKEEKEKEKKAAKPTKEEIKAQKEAKKKEKAEKKQAKDKEKAEKLALKQAEKEKAKAEKQEVEVEEEEEGRINPIGATIVFVFLGLIGAFIILGTNSFSYSASMKNASRYFNEKDYNNAYDEIQGLKIKKKDKEICDKITTVMYVNKELNSYNNYFSMEAYPEALDSLLKGLVRHDSYMEAARELGITQDLDFVKEKIVKELKDTFQLSEKQAKAIVQSESREKYSINVISAAAKAQ